MREPRFVAVPCRKKAPKVSAEGLSGRLRTGFSERLPDDHALLDGHVHRAVGDREGIVKVLQVAQRGVDAPLAQRVYVELGETCDLLVADVLRPELCVGQIEALFGGEAVDRCELLLAFERIVVGRVGDAQTALVGDVLAQAERAVGEEGRLIPLGGQYLDRIELLDQNVGLGCGPGRRIRGSSRGRSPRRWRRS